MAPGIQIGRCYKVVAALLQGQELDRRAIAELIGVAPAAADVHINTLVGTVPGIKERRQRHHRTIRFTGESSPGAASRSLVVAACFGASLARLFRGTPYESLFDEVRDSAVRRAKKSRDFGEARRKFLFITQAGEVALPDRVAILDDLVDAVLEQHRVLIDYTGFEGDKRSVEISPWSIAIYDHQLYVLAIGEASTLRAYRLSRISEVRTRTKTFTYPERSEYDPENLFRDTFGIFVRGEDPVEDVVLRLSPRWKTYARSHRWHSSQQVSEDGVGRVLVRMRVRTCSEFEAFVLGFGGEAEVVEPAGLRARIAAQVRALHEKYRDVLPPLEHAAAPARDGSRKEKVAGRS
jgi:predicted DNA-binding transcriptional regulator YafY